MRRLPLLAVLSALAVASSAEARLDLESRRLAFDRADGTYAATDIARLSLTYRPSGDPGKLTDVRVEVEIRTNPVTRVPFRIREVDVPQGDREFVMPLDFTRLGLPAGTYAVTATIDANDSFPESDEANNSARTTLTIGSRSTTPSAPTTPARPAGGQVLRPETSRVVAATTCSAFEREWTSPLEVGWHPGYGLASVVLDLRHPMTLARSDERVRRAVLRLRGDVAGRPIADLGALRVSARTKGARGSRCAAAPQTELTAATFDGEATIDLGPVLRAADALPDECADTLQIVLSFAQPRLEPAGAAFIRLAADGATIEVETERW